MVTYGLNEDHYSEHICPKCNALNFVCNGDPRDYTSHSGEGLVCKCWVCGHEFSRADLDDDALMEDIALMGDWDSELSTEQNLANAGREEGLPAADFNSLDKERFLESLCPWDLGRTWRGFILERLRSLNDGGEFWNEPRLKRLALVEKLLDIPPGIMALRDGFSKAMVEHHILGDTVQDDVKVFRMRLAETLLYMTGFQWGEIKHDPIWEIRR